MTNADIHKNYCISMEILNLYEGWQLPGTERKLPGNWQYDDDDLRRISLIATLFESGFQKEEVKRYMLLLSQGKASGGERLCMLNGKRSKILEELHQKEKGIEQLDYLRHEIRKQLEPRKTIGNR